MRRFLFAVAVLVFIFGGAAFAAQELALTPDTYPNVKIISDKGTLVNGEPKVIAVAFYYPPNTDYTTIVPPPHVVFQLNEYCASSKFFSSISRRRKGQSAEDAKAVFCARVNRPIVALAKNQDAVATIILEENIKKNFALGQLQKRYTKLSARSIVRKEVMNKLSSGISEASLAAAITSAIELSQRIGVSSDSMPEVSFELNHQTRKIKINAPGLDAAEKEQTNADFASLLGENEIEVV